MATLSTTFLHNLLDQWDNELFKEEGERWWKAWEGAAVHEQTRWDGIGDCWGDQVSQCGGFTLEEKGGSVKAAKSSVGTNRSRRKQLRFLLRNISFLLSLQTSAYAICLFPVSLLSCAPRQGRKDAWHINTNISQHCCSFHPFLHGTWM